MERNGIWKHGEFGFFRKPLPPPPLLSISLVKFYGCELLVFVTPPSPPPPSPFCFLLLPKKFEYICWRTNCCFLFSFSTPRENASASLSLSLPFSNCPAWGYCLLTIWPRGDAVKWMTWKHFIYIFVSLPFLKLPYRRHRVEQTGQTCELIIVLLLILLLFTHHCVS